MEYLIIFILGYHPFTALTERIEYTLPRAYIYTGIFNLFRYPVQSVYLFANIILYLCLFKLIKIMNRISVKFKIIFFLSENKSVVEIIDIVIPTAFVVFVKAPAYMVLFNALSQPDIFLLRFIFFLTKKQLPHIYNTAVSYLQKPSALFYHSRPLISSPKVIIVVPSIVTRSPSLPLFHRIPYSPPLYPARYRRAYPFSSFLLYATDRLQQEYPLAE